MEGIKKTIESKNFTAVEVGNLINWPEKIFLKDALKTTATEISLNTVAPKGEAPFFHIHKMNEEVYIFLSGAGDFQVDDECFPISSGSVIRVAPAGKRFLRNTSDEPMRYICIQAQENSLKEYTMTDGVLAECKKAWE